VKILKDEPVGKLFILLRFICTCDYTPCMRKTKREEREVERCDYTPCMRKTKREEREVERCYYGLQQTASTIAI